MESIRVNHVLRYQKIESSIFSQFYEFCYLLNAYRELLAFIIRGVLSREIITDLVELWSGF